MVSVARKKHRSQQVYAIHFMNGMSAYINFRATGASVEVCVRVSGAV
jgi:ubiquinone/menaquinone biosynthesis C-methylase UbiE